MGPTPHQLDVVTLAALTRQWVTASAHDEPAAAAIATQIVDNLLGTFGDFEHTRRIPDVAQVIEPGIHINTRPPGHVLIIDDKRETVILDLGGVVQICGINVTDWHQLTGLGHHLTAMGQAKGGQQPGAAAVSALADETPGRAELLDYALTVAHLTAEGDDIDGEAFVMENDDAWATLSAVIEQARQLLNITVPQGPM